jgi:hypothetical protein
VLFYFPDLARIRVVAQRDGVPPTLPDGHYLIAEDVWTRLGAKGVGEGDLSRKRAWRVFWTDTLRERGTTIPLVFAERRVAGSGSIPSTEPARPQAAALGFPEMDRDWGGLGAESQRRRPFRAEEQRP